MIISFGWTTPALLAGAKTMTRREWRNSHAAKFKAGMLIDAWNTSPRNVKGNPHKVATIRLTHDAELIRRNDLVPEDWVAEGFDYLTDHGLMVGDRTPTQVWRDWQNALPIEEHYIVRFEVVELL